MSQPIECTFARSPHARLKRVGSAMAVYVPEQKAIHVLNATAQLLFELLAEPTTLTELVQALVYATDGDPEIIAADVRATVDDFAGKGIIVEEPA